MVFLLAGELMRHFHSIIGVDGVDVLDRRHDVTMCGVITAEFVGDEPAGFPTLAFNQAAEEPDRRVLVAAALHQNIDRIAILIDRAPQIVLCALNGDNRFIEVSGIAQAALALFQFPRIRGAKLQAPLSNGFVGHDDAAFGEQFFHFTKAQAEAMIQPDGVTDDCGRKTMALVADCFGSHTSQSAKNQLT
jgi:hypothetical protein